MKSRRDFLKLASVGLFAIASKALPRFKPDAPKFTRGGIVPLSKQPIQIVDYSNEFVVPRGTVKATNLKMEITDLPSGKTYWVNWDENGSGDDSNDGLSPETTWATTQRAIDEMESVDMVFVPEQRLFTHEFTYRPNAESEAFMRGDITKS